MPKRCAGRTSDHGVVAATSAHRPRQISRPTRSSFASNGSATAKLIESNGTRNSIASSAATHHGRIRPVRGQSSRAAIGPQRRTASTRARADERDPARTRPATSRRATHHSATIATKTASTTALPVWFETSPPVAAPRMRRRVPSSSSSRWRLRRPAALTRLRASSGSALISSRTSSSWPERASAVTRATSRRIASDMASASRTACVPVGAWTNSVISGASGSVSTSTRMSDFSPSTSFARCWALGSDDWNCGPFGSGPSIVIRPGATPIAFAAAAFVVDVFAMRPMISARPTRSLNAAERWTSVERGESTRRDCCAAPTVADFCSSESGDRETSKPTSIAASAATRTPIATSRRSRQSCRIISLSSMGEPGSQRAGACRADVRVRSPPAHEATRPLLYPGMRQGHRSHSRLGGAITGLSAIIIFGAIGLVLLALLAPPSDRTASSRAAAPAATNVLHVGTKACTDRATPDVARNAATPWCTPQHALEAAPAGSVVEIAPGTYPAIQYSGEPRTGVVTLRGTPGRTIVGGLDLRGTGGFRVEGLVFTEVANLRNVEGVRLQGNELRGHGVIVTVSRNVAISNNRIHDLHGEDRGIYLRGDFRPGKPDNENILVHGNRIDRLDHDAIAFYNGYRNAVVENNVISRAVQPAGFDKHTDGMQFMGGDSLVVRGNVIRDSSKEAMLFKDGEPSRNLVVADNVVFNIPGPGIQVYSAPGARIFNNTVWGTKLGSFIGNDPAVRGDTRAALTRNVFDRLTLLSPGLVARASGNVFAKGTVVGRPAFRGRPNFVNPGRGDLRIRRSRPGAGLPRGKQPPGAQRSAA